MQQFFALKRRSTEKRVANPIKELMYVLALGVLACHAETKSPGAGKGGTTAEQAGTPAVAAAVVISTTARRPRPANWSVEYWSWLPSDGDPIQGTQDLVRALNPALMRVGGYNSDANQPAPFREADLDRAVAYAKAIGALPLLQVPLIGNVEGAPPSAAEAAEIVKYANKTRKYGVKYFAIGNEPDLYATQGSLVDPGQPAFPGYSPHDYCVDVAKYSVAMKAVDPTIKIVGPQLAYKYQANNDWLTPILQECGDKFDIISIQRFPFNSAQASIENAAVDAAALRRLIGSIRKILSNTGYADKPLAITGMNIAYDTVPYGLEPNDAVPGTLGAALWLADITGTAQELDLWTTVFWDVSDSDVSSLGLIGPPPKHTPRPPYYAYRLFADHFGPTLLEVTQSPTGISAHATRNLGDDATHVIVINWHSAPVVLGFELTGLSAPHESPIIELSARSMAAVEIPDTGSASAWVYGPEQAAAGKEPQTLLPVAGQISSEIVDWPQLAAPSCFARAITNPQITVSGRLSATGPSFASATEAWGSFTFAGEGQPRPTMAVTTAGDGFKIEGKLVEPLTNNYVGVGLYFNNPYCGDASAYTGVEFKVSGELEGCRFAFGASSSAHVSAADDPPRGHCLEGQPCYGAQTDLTGRLGVLTSDGGASGTEPDIDMPTAVTLQVPFSSLRNGSPVSTLDPSTLENIQWMLSASGGSCQANLTITDVALY